MPDGQVVFEISADGKKAYSSLDDFTRAVEQAGKKWDRTVDDSADNMQQSFTKAFNIERVKDFGIKLGESLVKIAKASIDAASDLREVQNVVDVTFGENASQIDAWAKTAINQFGLTETKAKQFASTMGAMMKSSGLAGPEIVDMSEKLSGLAADMSSFYNMDFDTAFQKIRSGISGETEPLKQLGINMSVANLNAFALEKGLGKAFDKMSQSEQIMVRYQYLMQATADAQGDFARTSDGYANSLRLLEANVQSIQTKLGSLLIPALEQATGWVNTFLGALTPTEKETILDKFKNIDLQTEQKLNDLRKVADEANALSSVLDSIAKTDASAAIESLANGANALNAGSPETWTSLLTALKQANGLSSIFSNDKAGKNVEELANALSGSAPDTDKAAAWNEFLGTLQANAGALSTLTGKSAEETSAWLTSIAEAANKIDPSDAEAWNKLLSNFVGGLPGLADTESGKAFFDAMSANFLAMGAESEQAKAGLAALGMNTDQIKEKQNQWLAVCKQLVQTIPGLSSVINAETGEINGGVDAVRDYVEAYSNAQRQIAMLNAIAEKRQALEGEQAKLNAIQTEKGIQEAVLNARRNAYAKYVDFLYKSGKMGQAAMQQIDPQYGISYQARLAELESAIPEAERQIQSLTAEYDALAPSVGEATKALDEQEAAVLALGYQYEQTAEEAQDTAEALTDIEIAADNSAEGQKEALDRVKKSVNDAKDAYKELAEHIEKVRGGIDSTVSGMFGVFNNVQTPMQKAKAAVKDLTDELHKGTLEADEYKKRVSGETEAYQSTKKIIDNLQSQIDYMTEYNNLLNEAKKNGLSEELASALSDGSVESFDFLTALNNGKSDITKINDMYKEVQSQKTGFVDALTQQKLKTDEVFDAIVAKAQEATAGLDQSGAAKTALENTVQGMVDGIAAKIPSLEEQVKQIGDILATLEGYGLSFSGINLGTIGGDGGINLNFSGGANGTSAVSINSQEIGMDRVPFDGYLAALHEGESILTAEEARIWRNIKYGPSLAGNQFDYGAMGSAIGANMPNFNGMQVVWNGQVLGRVIAAQQADSLRTMERSGWRG